jgi:hypothetical protein
VVEVIARFDRSTLPPFNPFYSDIAYWELHRRLATLSLVLLAGLTGQVTAQLAIAALARIPSLSAEPVLQEVARWARNPLTSIATGELERRASQKSS